MFVSKWMVSESMSPQRKLFASLIQIMGESDKAQALSQATAGSAALCSSSSSTLRL